MNTLAIPKSNKVSVNENDLSNMIGSLNRASEIFDHLETLAKLIKEKSLDDCTVCHLAEIVENISSDWSNMLDVDHEEYQEKYFPKEEKQAA